MAPPSGQLPVILLSERVTFVISSVPWLYMAPPRRSVAPMLSGKPPPSTRVRFLRARFPYPLMIPTALLPLTVTSPPPSMASPASSVRSATWRQGSHSRAEHDTHRNYPGDGPPSSQSSRGQRDQAKPRAASEFR